ncbi:hypothetical protein GOV14_04120 [Candidatus Pacearchaeota archaeon]|nr:hypothetical protein [Candidatus Pacearchaeota archaeon]
MKKRYYLLIIFVVLLVLLLFLFLLPKANSPDVSKSEAEGLVINMFNQLSEDSEYPPTYMVIKSKLRNDEWVMDFKGTQNYNGYLNEVESVITVDAYSGMINCILGNADYRELELCGEELYDTYNLCEVDLDCEFVSGCICACGRVGMYENRGLDIGTCECDESAAEDCGCVNNVCVG